MTVGRGCCRASSGGYGGSGRYCADNPPGERQPGQGRSPGNMCRRSCSVDCSEGDPFTDDQEWHAADRFGCEEGISRGRILALVDPGI